MKQRRKILLALLLSASVAVTPAASVPVLAEDLDIASDEIAVESEEADTDVTDDSALADDVESADLTVEEADDEDTAEDADADADLNSADLFSAGEVDESAVGDTDAETKTHSIKVSVTNSTGTASGMYAMDSAVATKQDDGTYLVRMHQTSTNRNYMALTDDKNKASNHEVDWYVAGGDDGYWYTIPVANLTDSIHAYFTNTDRLSQGEDWSNIQTITFDTSSMKDTTEKDAVSSDINKLQATVTTTLNVTNNTGMFKVASAILKKDEKSTSLIITLSGQGYHYLYKGTYEEAVANGDNRDNWITGEQQTDQSWQFTIPVSDGETFIPIVAISNSYLTKYEQGKNTLERAFYPRQAVIDETAATLVTGDYDHTKDLTVSNSVKMFNVAAASLETIGGPNSNNYQEVLHLTMGSDSFDKVFIGSAEDAANAESTTEITNRKADLVVKANAMGGATTTDYLGQKVIFSFHSVKNNTWYERYFTVNKTASSLEIMPVVHATGITLSDTTKTTYVNDTFNLTATVEPSDSTDPVTWTSSNPEVATVDNAGTVTGVATGEATITVTAGAYTATCSLTVKPNTFSFKIQPMIWKGSGAATKDATDVKATATDTNGKVIEAVKDASQFMVFDNLDVHKSYTVKISREGYNVLKKLSQTSYQPINETVYTKDITVADDTKSETVAFQLDELTAILKDIPTDTALYDNTSYTALKEAVDAADTSEKDVSKRDVAADKIKTAIASLKLKTDGTYLTEATVTTGLKMYNLILTVENGAIKAQFIGSTTAYGKIYMGSSSDAKNASDEDPNMILPGNDGNALINSEGKEGYQFTIPVNALGTPITFSSYATARKKWSEQTVTFSAAGIKKCGVSLDKTESTLKQGNTTDLTATVILPVGENQTVSWKSSNEKVATVVNGKVTAIGEGEATITATAGNYSAECKVTVYIPATVTPQPTPQVTSVPSAVKVTGISVKSTLSTKIAAGKKVQLKATIAPSNAANKAVKWTTSNPKVATVSSKGVVTFKKNAGGKKVTITAIAKDGSKKSNKITLTCMKGSVKSIKLSGKTTLKSGKTTKLKAKVTTQKGKSNKSVVWSSSNTKLATVDKNGKVKAVKGKKGTVKITAKATDGSGKKATIKIKIK